jgi:NhaA family Na+:H+ antiporter
VRIVRGLRLPIQSYIRTEEFGAIILLLAAVAALIWVNSPWSDEYHDLWETLITVDLDVVSVELDLRHWINDGLMGFFFFLLGLEIKREIVHGEISNLKHAALPIAAAVGGTAAPVAFYLLFNAGGPGEGGWGVPMGTDTAFVLGILALLGRRIPMGLRVFLVTSTVIDDLGAITVLAAFYTEDIDWGQIAMAGVLLAVLLVLTRLRVPVLSFYIILGGLMWLAVLNSGIQAVITGAILGILVPTSPRISKGSFSETSRQLIDRHERAVNAGNQGRVNALLRELEGTVRSVEAPVERMERIIHPWVSFLVLPVFALANAGVEMSAESLREGLGSPITAGVFVGLVVGKTVGIWGASRAAVLLKVGQLPRGVGWGQMLGISMLCGVGFTFAIYIAELAFADPNLAKMGVIAASLVAGIGGYVVLSFSGKRRVQSRVEAGVGRDGGRRRRSEVDAG